MGQLQKAVGRIYTFKLLALNILFFFSSNAQQISVKPKSNCSKANIVLMIDYSGSVDKKISLLSQALEIFGLSFDLNINGIMLSAGIFHEEVQTTNITDDYDVIASFVANHKNQCTNKSTNILRALQKSKELFDWVTLQHPHRQDFRNILIFVSDGEHTIQTETSPMDYALRYKKSHKYLDIFAIDLGTNTGATNTFMALLSSSPKHHIFSDYDSLAQKLLNLDPCL